MIRKYDHYIHFNSLQTTDHPEMPHGIYLITQETTNECMGNILHFVFSFFIVSNHVEKPVQQKKGKTFQCYGRESVTRREGEKEHAFIVVDDSCSFYTVEHSRI